MAFYVFLVFKKIDIVLNKIVVLIYFNAFRNGKVNNK